MREELFAMKGILKQLILDNIENPVYMNLKLINARYEYNVSLSRLTNLIMSDIHNNDAEAYRIKIQLLLDLARI